MLGFWDYTVILTYLSFASGGIGIFLAASMQLKWAVFCLACSGLLDMFDGRLPGRKRTGQQMRKTLEYRLIHYVILSVLAYFQ